MKKSTVSHIKKSKEFLKGAQIAQERGLSFPSVVSSIFSVIQMGNALAIEYCQRSFNQENIADMPEALEAEMAIPKEKLLILKHMIEMRDFSFKTMSLNRSASILRKAKDFHQWAGAIL